MNEVSRCVNAIGGRESCRLFYAQRKLLMPFWFEIMQVK